MIELERVRASACGIEMSVIAACDVTTRKPLRAWHLRDHSTYLGT